MAGTPVRFERRMTGTEALLWSLETDPTLRPAFLGITFLDRPPSFAGFRRRIERAVSELPRLRQRVVAAPARLAPPEWVDDRSFDLDFHLRRTVATPPGTDRQLLDLAALQYQDPLDGARPLWQLTLVDGLAQGRAALLAKIHHTIADGLGAVRLTTAFVDLARDAPDPVPPDPSSKRAAGDQDAEGLAGRAIVDALRRGLDAGRRAAQALAAVVSNPASLPERTAEAAELTASLLRQLVVTDPARSPLWRDRRSPCRRVDVLSVDLERLKRAARALGGTVNDAFVTAVAGAAGAYHREQGVDAGELRMAMPVSTRGPRSGAANAFTPARVLVPAGVEDPVERFATVRSRLAATKAEPALALTDTAAELLTVLPAPLVVRLAGAQARTVDFAASNVRGPAVDLYVAGARVDAVHPVGPTAGAAFNVTMLSYRDRLDLGLNVDTVAVDDPELLGRCVAAAFDEVLAAA
jgi:diacylglycerol O-acyltransferase